MFFRKSQNPGKPGKTNPLKVTYALSAVDAELITDKR